VKIGLVQITNFSPARTTCPIRSPSAELCAEVQPESRPHEFLTPLYKRVRIADAVEALKDADLVGFSTYV